MFNTPTWLIGTLEYIFSMFCLHFIYILFTLCLHFVHILTTLEVFLLDFVRLYNQNFCNLHVTLSAKLSLATCAFLNYYTFFLLARQRHPAKATSQFWRLGATRILSLCALASTKIHQLWSIRTIAKLIPAKALMENKLCFSFLGHITLSLSGQIWSVSWRYNLQRPFFMGKISQEK